MLRSEALKIMMGSNYQLVGLFLDLLFTGFIRLVLNVLLLIAEAISQRNMKF